VAAELYHRHVASKPRAGDVQKPFLDWAEARDDQVSIIIERGTTMVNDEQAQRFRIFYYDNVTDPVIKYGYMAADTFIVVFALWFLVAVVRHWTG